MDTSNITQRTLSDIKRQGPDRLCLTLNDVFAEAYIDAASRTKTVDEANKLMKTEMEYRARAQRPSTTVHLGQLKLFLSTYQFLSLYSSTHMKTHIIYPGSAPGNNIELLTKLYPDHMWYLWDPRDFFEPLYNNKNVIIYQRLFDDAEARFIKNQLEGHYTLLISDIRDCECPDENNVNDCNMLQKSWMDIVSPQYAQFKFRIPRNVGSIYEYMNGIVYLQMYAANTTTETRLVVKKDYEMTKYNIEAYEGGMYYFNNVLRPSSYDKECNIEHLDSCHDCSAMIAMLGDDTLKLLDEIPNIRKKLKKDWDFKLSRLLS